MSASNQVSIRWVEEKTWGVLPDEVEGKIKVNEILIESESIDAKPETIESNDIAPTRDESPDQVVGEVTAGGLTLALRPQHMLNFVPMGMESAFAKKTLSATAGDGVTVLAGAVDITVADQKITFANQADYDAIKTARLIRIANSPDALNNGTKEIVDKDDAAKTLTLKAGSINSDTDSATTAALALTVQPVRNGATMRSIWLQKAFKDQIPVGYETHDGLVMNGWTLDAKAKQRLTLALDLKGRHTEVGTVATPDIEVVKPVAEAAAVGNKSVATLYDNAGNVLTSKISTAGIKIDNGLRDTPILGQDYTDDYSDGAFSATVDLEALFKNTKCKEAVLKGEQTSLDMVIAFPSGEKARIWFPALFGKSNTMNVSGKNTTLMQKLSMKAADAGEGFTMQVDFV